MKSIITLLLLPLLMACQTNSFDLDKLSFPVDIPALEKLLEKKFGKTDFYYRDSEFPTGSGIRATSATFWKPIIPGNIIMRNSNPAVYMWLQKEISCLTIILLWEASNIR